MKYNVTFQGDSPKLFVDWIMMYFSVDGGNLVEYYLNRHYGKGNFRVVRRLK